METVRGGLQRHVSGRTFDTVQVLHPRAARRHLAGPDDFAAALTGGHRRRCPPSRQVPVAAGRRRRADRPSRHERPAGGRRAGPAAHAARPGPVHVHRRRPRPALRRPADVRAPVVLARRRRAARRPSRTSRPTRSSRPSTTSGSPPGCCARRTGIKRALLDQSLISGVGNIYADESLWRAGLHWARGTDALRRSDVVRLLGAVREVFAEAIMAGGTSFDSLYVHVNGESGYFDRSLAVYGRAGQPCPRCGTAVRRDKFMNRSSFSCPKCQPRPRRGRW